MSCSSTASFGAELHFCCVMHSLVFAKIAMRFWRLSASALRPTACRSHRRRRRGCARTGTRLCGFPSRRQSRRETRSHRSASFRHLPPAVQRLEMLGYFLVAAGFEVVRLPPCIRRAADWTTIRPVLDALRIGEDDDRIAVDRLELGGVVLAYPAGFAGRSCLDGDAAVRPAPYLGTPQP